jgi:transcriptional repressor NrdR
MKCPDCGNPDDKVIDSRVSKEGDSIRRRRECTACGARFTTHEIILKAEMVVIKNDGAREDFDPGKIRSGIRHACWKRPVSEAQVDKMVHAVVTCLENLQQREIKAETIGEAVMDELHNVDHVAYVRFASVYRSFEDVGEFISEIQNLADKAEKPE